MTETEFKRRIAATRMRHDDLAAEACRLVLVHGKTAYSVFKATGIDQSQISRAIKVIKAAKPARVCAHCGSKL